MNQDLRNLLDHITTPAQADGLVAVEASLIALGFEGHVLELNNEISMAYQGDNEETLDNIKTLLVIGAQACLDQFEIQIVDETPFPSISALLDGIVSLEHYDDSLYLLDVLRSTQTPEEKLAVVMGEVTEYDWTSFILYLDKVSTTFIDKLDALLTLKTGDDLPEVNADDHATIIERAKSWYKTTEHTEGFESYRTSLPIGMNVLFLMDKARESLAAESSNQCATVMFWIGLISSLPNDHIAKTLLDLIEEITDDLDFISRVNSKLRSLLKENGYLS